MPAPLSLDGHSLSIAGVVAVARHGVRVAIAPHALAAVTASRRTVEAAVARGDTIYGVNTGFGKLAHVRIKPEQTRELQRNLIRSHASGVGDPLSVDVVRAMMLLRANVLVRGTSGVRPALPELIVEMLNAQVHPRVPSQGSVGASGDLAPLAHLALAMMGEGADGAALRASGLRPITLEAKEGLAFVNGTQAQTGMAALLVHDAWVLWRTAHAAAAMSLEAVRGTPELNAATDNPLVFDDVVLSGGNFHGQPIALALDVIGIALATLAGLAERRIERIVNPDLSSGLPPFLARDPGVESGFMTPQIAAAALVAECRVLATPASVQSVPTEGNQEDIVPMGMTAAWKAERILGNAARIVAVELLAGAQGLEFLKPLAPGQGVRRTYAAVRRVAEALDGDRPFTEDIERGTGGIREGEFEPEAS